MHHSLALWLKIRGIFAFFWIKICLEHKVSFSVVKGTGQDRSCHAVGPVNVIDLIKH